MRNNRNDENLDPGRLACLHEASGGGLNDDYRRPEFYASPKSRSSIKHWQGARSFVEWNPEVQRRRLAAT